MGRSGMKTMREMREEHDLDVHQFMNDIRAALGKEPLYQRRGPDAEDLPEASVPMVFSWGEKRWK